MAMNRGDGGGNRGGLDGAALEALHELFERGLNAFLLWPQTHDFTKLELELFFREKSDYSGSCLEEFVVELAHVKSNANSNDATRMDGTQCRCFAGAGAVARLRALGRQTQRGRLQLRCHQRRAFPKSEMPGVV